MKSDRIEAFVTSLKLDPSSKFPACYLGYFHCFNAGDYYEAHDVLEHLWLECLDADSGFYKGLIQIAGAFVHLKKHHAFPQHPKHGRRLRPAVRLFALGIRNLEIFGSYHLGLDVAALCSICRNLSEQIEISGFSKNPWAPGCGPLLKIDINRS